MRHKSPATWIFNRRNHSLPWLEAKGLGFRSPGFYDLAFSIDLQYFADPVGHEQIAFVVEIEPVGPAARLQKGGQSPLRAPFENAVIWLVGEENIAVSAGPSWNPATPVPANVVTSLRGEIFRTILLPVSATKTFPEASTQMPWG